MRRFQGSPLRPTAMSGWLSATLFSLLLCTISALEGENSTSSQCVDSDAKCALWASQGECQSNAVWMMANCRRSCQSCQGGDRAWKLRAHLTQNYDNTTANATARIVRLESVRINHVEIDEAKQLVRVFGRFVTSWNDSKVTWDKDQWGISWLNFYWIQVWTPQFVQINSPSNTPGTVTGKVLAANYTGQVYMWSDFNFVAPYHFAYDDYPNDEQRICYKFDDKRYFTVRFVVSPEVQNRRRESVAETHLTGWTVEDLEVTDSKYVIQILGDWKQNPFDVQTNNCEMCLTLKRNAVFYLTEMLVPALANTAMTLSAVLFQLSTIQPALLAFSIVSQILSLTLINARMPAFTNSTPTILKYTAFNLISTLFLFLLSLILRKLSQSRTQLPPPHFINRFLNTVDNLLSMPSAQSKDAEDAQGGQYTHAAHTFNNLIFAFFFCIYIVCIAFSFVF